MERRRKRGVPAATPPPSRKPRWRELGVGLITGAADDDPSAIGTYANAGAGLGLGILWVAPIIFPLATAAIYLSAKLGQAAGQGMGAILRHHYPRWLLWLIVAAVVAGNTFEAAADLGGAASALRLLVPLPLMVWVVVVGGLIVAMLWWGSYARIGVVFRWLALALLAYVGAALLARPQWPQVVSATLIPDLHFSRDYWLMVVAIIGTSFSPYLIVWQASQTVEEDISMGRRRLSDRKGTSRTALRRMGWNIGIGMLFSTVIMYFIFLSAATAIFPTGIRRLDSAAQAAEALQPLAGAAAGWLFAAGVIGVGFLAVPVMAVGAGYMVCDALGWKNGLTAHPFEARAFYTVIVAVVVAAAVIDSSGINPIHALVAAGVVQGLLAPVLLLLLMLMTNNRAVVGEWTNGHGVNAIGWLATGLVTAAACVLVLSAV